MQENHTRLLNNTNKNSIDTEESKEQSSQSILNADFKGSKIYFHKYSRTRLPFLRPPNEKTPIWNIMKKFIGKDMTKVPMPVILNEPLGAL